MPYRLSGLCVQVERADGWHDLKCHATEAEAKAHLTALTLNVDEAHKIAEGTFSKLDEERHLAFGWAYVAKKGDALVVDHSGDYVDDIALPDLEDAVYRFVLESREADEMHERFEGVGKIVESVMLTPEKMEAMGITGERIGWWAGIKVQDPEVWTKIKDGTYAAFSIRGKGVRESEDDAETA